MEPDWIIHLVLCERPSSHTHGLDKHSSLELELNLPLVKRSAGMILNLLGREIAENGKRYQSGDREIEVFNLPVYFFETEPAVPDACFKRVLRVLLCDPAGEYPWEDGCEERYAKQLSPSEKRDMSALYRQRYRAETV